jgi:anthranilate phosphoribosyltransferase
MSAVVRVRGNATPEDVVAVLTALSARPETPMDADAGYEAWRRVRVEAVRRTDPGSRITTR